MKKDTTRSTRSLTQPETSHNIKKHSSSSGSGDVVDAGLLPTSSSSAVAGTTRTSPSTSTTDRTGEAFHNIQEAASQFLCKPFRVMVSQNRRRYQTDGFDLDLTYITDRIIAMGYPAETSEAIYRNSMNDTQSFLERNHRDHYKVFNLRGRYVYDPSKFHHRVINFEMTDHHPPRLELMAPFCRDVHEYLEEDPSNVVAVHCKAGKGRTGVMICAYLVYINFYPSPRQNMDYYSIVRTKNNKGVTIPSQRRYVYYFSHLRNHQLNYMPLKVELVGVFFERPPKIMPKMCTKSGFSLAVANGDVPVFRGEELWLNGEDWAEEERAWSGNVVSHGEGSHDPANPVPGSDIISRRAWGWMVPPHQRVFLEGDVRINLYSERKVLMFNKEKGKVGHIWLNTMFACPGFCGGTYRHGDEAHPYPDGATTIAEKKPQAHRPKTGSASLPSSPPVADAATRGSEPHIDRNAEEAAGGGKKLDRRGRKDKEPSRPAWDDDMELVLPPGLNEHCSEDSLRLIYGSDKQPPRVSIEEMLRDAHKNNLMVDSYNHRRLSVPQEGSPVVAASEGRPSASGPNLIRREKDEHVQVFSVLEIDRACKNKDIDPNFKMFVVTRCVPPEVDEDQKRAASFLRLTHEKQSVWDKRLQDKMRRSRRQQQAAGSATSMSDVEAKASACAEMLGDPRRSDPFMSKFFQRQRHDSMSIYPGQLYRCPLAAPLSGSNTSEVFSNCVARHPLVTSAQGASSGNSGEWTLDAVDARCEELSELDLEVRSYHPELGPEHSGSSGSSSSSEDVVAETVGMTSFPDANTTAPVATAEETGSIRSPPPVSSAERT